MKRFDKLWGTLNSDSNPSAQRGQRPHPLYKDQRGVLEFLPGPKMLNTQINMNWRQGLKYASHGAAGRCESAGNTLPYISIPASSTTPAGIQQQKGEALHPESTVGPMLVAAIWSAVYLQSFQYADADVSALVWQK